MSRHSAPGLERRLLTAAAGAGFVALALGAFLARSQPDRLPGWKLEATEEYGRLWGKLQFRAAEAGRAFRAPPQSRAERLASFQRLAQLSEMVGAERASIRLIDADGEPAVWVGSGLAQEPRPVEIPRQGVDFRAGWTAVTLLAVEPIEAEAKRPWRVLAGESFAVDRLPFRAPGGGELPAGFRWSLVAANSAPTEWEAFRLELPGFPSLVGTAVPSFELRREVFLPWARWAAALTALALLATALLSGLDLGPGASRWAAFRVALLAAVGTTGLAWSLRAALAPAAFLGLGVGLAAASLLELPAPRPRGRRRGLGSLLGAVAAVATVGLAWLYQQWRGPVDLGAELWPGAGPFTLRLALAAVALAGFYQASRRGRAPTRDETVDDSAGAAWFALALLLLAALLVDQAASSALVLAISGAVFGAWLSHRDPSTRAGSFAVILVLSCLASGVSWEIAYRHQLRLEVRDDLLPKLSPPGEEFADRIGREISAHVAGLDLARLAGRPLAGLDMGDLAYAVWRDSPLSRRNALSAVTLTALGEFESQTFSFGLPVGSDGIVRFKPETLAPRALPIWDDRLAQGELEITVEGRAWGALRWWLVPRPGFGLAPEVLPEAVLMDLLKGTPGDPRAPAGLPPQVLYALYPANGRALISPWRDQPPASPEILGVHERGEALVNTPAGRAWAFVRRGEDGLEVLYLPRLETWAALERVTTQAATVLLFFALLAALVLLATLPRPAVQGFFLRTVRSYSRRLVLIYTALLLLPLLFLNLVLLRAVGASLSRAQEERGEQAALAAQRAVVDKILSQPVGFGVDTALTPEYLKSLSREVDHDVTVYFGPDFLASSTGELFASGLLPHRIPGEVYAQMVLVGYGVAERTSRVAGSPYLELYTPIRLQADDPGSGEDDPELFLSVPLLAQQEDTAAALAALSRRAVVATAALLGLLLAVGGRLARNFTKPLAELVEGTRRIAAGAPSLDFAPSELELAALVEAVDEMARRIARSREELLREKAVVERMVDSITSAVVSLDAEHRVMMRNRVAGDLLGLSVGDGLEARANLDPRLAPLAGFLANVLAPPAREPQRETVRLSGFEGGEREWTLVWVPLPGPGEPSALLVVEDSTEVFRGQRLTAWAEMARIIAHEIKNPLTPIRLSTEHMLQVWRHDPDRFSEIFERCAGNILQQVDELQQIASEFSIYSRIPKIEVLRQDLRPALGLLVEGYRVASPPGVEVRWRRPDEPVMVRFDERLLLRAVRNLLENAVRAASSPSAGGAKDPAGQVDLVIETEGDQALILVEDNGTGVPPELLQRIFDPYFSTHDTGTGLGLPIARRVVEEHGGSIVARNRAGGGLAVEIRIPLA